MALGARRAFDEIADRSLRDRFLRLPFLGIDGVRTTGQTYVRRGLLTATVIVPTNTDQAIEMVAHALQTGTIPPEKTLTLCTSLPAFEELTKKPVQKSQAKSAH
jgi:hypothetical protein